MTARTTARQRASSPTALGIVLICLGILPQTSSPSGLLLVATGATLAGVILQLPPSARPAAPSTGSTSPARDAWSETWGAGRRMGG